MTEVQVGLSAGTASALGLSRARMGVPPTTAYIMIGRGCSRSCAFCAQAGAAGPASARLSRITWPLHPVTEVLPRLREAVAGGSMVRACLQVVGGHEEQALTILTELYATGIPVNVSLHVSMATGVGRFLAAGASTISLPLDACGEPTFARVKGGQWSAALSAVMTAAGEYPGRIATHLIRGVGESEQELLETAVLLLEAGVKVGLFAFTSLPGTAMADTAPPEPASYRRVQAALHLTTGGHIDCSGLLFSGGRLIGVGLAAGRLRHLLADGSAFETSGCRGCNRPYYNESPRGFTYNYPRPLTPAEAAAAVDIVLSGLEAGEEAGS